MDAGTRTVVSVAKAGSESGLEVVGVSLAMFDDMRVNVGNVVC